MAINNVMISGRLVSDPQVRGEENKIARYTLAVNSGGRKDEEGNDITYYVNCIAFGKAAETAEKFRKGLSVMVDRGSIQTGSYTNREGLKVYTTEVAASHQCFDGDGKHPINAQVNQVCLQGRLTADPVIRETASTKIASYTLAVDRGRKDADGNNIADFIRCTCFGQTANFAEKWLRKGRAIIIDDGRLQTGSYTNKEGQKVYTTDVVVNHHQFELTRQEPEPF